MNIRVMPVYLIVGIILVVVTGCAGSLVTPPAAQPVDLSTTASGVQGKDFVTDLDVPWEMAFAPDGRIFITERPGKILVIKDGKLQDEPWISLDVAAVGEGGLLGMALDPQFAENHYVYVSQTYQISINRFQNRLVRLRQEPDTGKGVIDKILLDNIAGNVFHDGGRVKFGPDGKLYWTMGEAGNPELAQDLSSLNGKILRINPDGTIPEDNPFPGSPVYSYGHRNPQGLAWQPGTGRLYETEHGPSGGFYGVGQDEVNYIEPGKNYGWPVIHGDQSREGMVSPVIQSGGSETWAPGGCTFVTGGPWDGSLLFAGLRGQSLYRLAIDKNDPTKAIALEKYLTGQYGRFRDVVQGPDGTLYLITNNTDGRGDPRPGDDRILQLTLSF
ncbi:MAG TPA: PQQ-dependent sugar dehydrogenase [Dehalococcoidia bacterium]